MPLIPTTLTWHDGPYGDEVERAKSYQDHPNFPWCFGLESVRVVCPPLKEKITPAPFNSRLALCDAHIGRFNMGAGLMVLTLTEGEFGQARDDFLGRWHGRPIQTVYRWGWGGGVSHTKWKESSEYRDISKDLVLHMRSVHPGFTGSSAPCPETYRRIIAESVPPNVSEDYSWLSVDDVLQIRRSCTAYRTGMWEKLRAWLMRRQLSDEVRLAMGGRPGRLRVNKPLEPDREARGIKIRRKEND